MTTSEFVSAVYLVAAGKIPTFTSGSAKWNKIVAIGNNKIDVWQSEPGVDWSSLYDPAYSLGSVTATNTVDLDDEIRKISDERGDTIRILHTDGVQTTEYTTVPSDQLKYFPSGAYCAQVGRTIVFNRTFTSDDAQFGGTILVPAYLFAEKLVGTTDDVPVDDPQWLVLVSAAEYVRNDIVKQNQYPNLVNEANSIMTKMRENNESQLEEVPTVWAPLGRTW